MKRIAYLHLTDGGLDDLMEISGYFPTGHGKSLGNDKIGVRLLGNQGLEHATAAVHHGVAGLGHCPSGEVRHNLG